MRIALPNLYRSHLAVRLLRLRDSLVGGLALLALLAGCASPKSVEEAAAPATVRIPRFEAAAESLGLRFAYENGSSGRFYYPEVVGGGGALFDYDGDGWLDIYLPQGASLPGHRSGARLRNRLYRNLGAGRGFEDVTDRGGVDGTRDGRKLYCIGTAVGDYDNSGAPDLFVTGFEGCILYRNNGDGSFTDVTRSAGLADTAFGSSAAFLDYDRDGHLDLFACEYVTYRLEDDVRCGGGDRERDYCQPGYYPAARSVLYRNLGNGRFADVTEKAGITNSSNKALGVVAGDVNDDGHPDIYVACDLTPNLLYLNQGDGTFREEALAQGCAVSAAGRPDSGMGVDLRDADGDLRPEILVTNYWGQYNSFYRHLGAAGFREAGATAGLGGPNQKQVSFGTALRDFNNDGWADIFVTNGHVLLRPGDATPGAARLQEDQLFVNLGKGEFREVSRQAGPWFSQAHLGRGAAFGDVDNNGALDVLVVSGEGPATLLMNRTEGTGNWVQFRLQGRESNRDGIGARIEVTANGRTQADDVRSAYSYCSANDLRVHFGLGPAARLERVVIRWPSGHVDRFADLELNRIFTVTERGNIH